MSDLIARLRTMSATGWHPIGDEAADEIDRLTRERNEARAEREALRAALTELYEAEGAAFPAAPIGREAQDAWCERRVNAREQARAALAQIEQERSEQAKEQPK